MKTSDMLFLKKVFKPTLKFLMWCAIATFLTLSMSCATRKETRPDGTVIRTIEFMQDSTVRTRTWYRVTPKVIWNGSYYRPIYPDQSRGYRDYRYRHDPPVSCEWWDPPREHSKTWNSPYPNERPSHYSDRCDCKSCRDYRAWQYSQHQRR